MEKEDSYKQNDTIFYHEAGQIFQATVIETKSDDKYVQYTLNISRQVSGPREGEIPHSGLEITVIKGQQARGGTWRIARFPKPNK